MTSKLEWKRAKRNRIGSRYWEDRRERFMVVAGEWCLGVKLSPVYFTAWELYTVRDRGGRTFTSWRKISRHRSRGTAARACQRRAGVQRKGAEL